VVVAAVLMSMVIQSLSAKLGIASGMNLAEACRDRYRRPVVRGLWVQAELVAMATDVADPANYETIWNGSAFNYVHSAMGGLAVGNDIVTTSETEAGRAFIYDFETETFTDIVFPGTISNTAYGIWDNGDGSYTIAGGFSQLPVNNADDRLQPIGMASLVDYDRLTGTFSNWRAFSYQSPDQVTAATHFMGISSVEQGVYTLSGTGFVSGVIESSGLATVVRQTDGSFGDMAWVDRVDANRKWAHFHCHGFGHSANGPLAGNVRNDPRRAHHAVN